MDKSTTHIKVVKNSHETWIPKDVWAQLKENKDTNGFIEVAEIPVEVQLQRQKSKEAISEIIEDIDVEAIEVKKRGRKPNAVTNEN